MRSLTQIRIIVRRRVKATFWVFLLFAVRLHLLYLFDVCVWWSILKIFFFSFVIQCSVLVTIAESWVFFSFLLEFIYTTKNRDFIFCDEMNIEVKPNQTKKAVKIELWTDFILSMCSQVLCPDSWNMDTQNKRYIFMLMYFKQ